MIDWIVKIFQAMMDFLMGEIKDPSKEEKKIPESHFDDLIKKVDKHEYEKQWIHDTLNREYIDPSSGVRASEKFATLQKVSDRVKKVDNTKSPRTVNINRSGVVRSGNSDSHVNTHGFIEEIIPTVTHFHHWSEPERSSGSSYESSSSSYSDSSSSSSYDSFGGGSSDGGGASSDF